MVQVTVSAWRNDRGSGDGACRAGDGRVREKKPPVMRCIVSCHFGVRNDRGFRPTAGPALPAVTNEQEGSEGRPCQSLYLGNTAVAHVAASESSSLRSLSLPEPLAPPPVTTRTRPSSWAAFAPPPPARLDPISRVRPIPALLRLHKDSRFPFHPVVSCTVITNLLQDHVSSRFSPLLLQPCPP